MQLITDERYRFPFEPAAFWSQIARVDAYRDWWPWLHQFDADPLEAGAVWSCTVHPPVPYVVRFEVHLDEVVVEHHIAARITGDIEGRARLWVEPEVSGCSVTLRSALAPRKRSLRVMSVAARPMVRFGHHWILAAGVRQFERRSQV